MLAPRSDVHLLGMPTATRRHTRPLITSTLILRALAAAITLSSFGGMTIFASENLHLSNAPLRPAAVATATATPSAAATRTTVRGSVSSTSTAALTRTKQS